MSMDSMLRTTAVLTGWVFSAAAVTLSMGGAIGAYSLANLILASLALSVVVSIAAIAAPFIPKPSGFTIHARPARPTQQSKSLHSHAYHAQDHEHTFSRSRGHFYSWKAPTKTVAWTDMDSRPLNDSLSNKSHHPHKSTL